MAATGNILPVPILVTDCLDDGTIFSVGEPTITHDDYIALIRKYFGTAAAPAIGDYYGPTPSCDGTPYFEASSFLLRDALITCPLDAFGGLAAASEANNEVFYFRFNTPLRLAWLIGSLPYVPDYGVFHGTELILLFQGLSSLTIGQAHEVNHTQRRIMEWMKGKRPDDPKYPKENPSKQITKPLQIDKICNLWSKWPLSPEFLEAKMFDGWSGASGTTIFTSEIR
jgi:carboxylesterase type B